MICPDCQQAELKTSRKNHRYEESGLDNIVLQGIEVSECPECAAQHVSIPAIAQLHRAIAVALLHQQSALLPAEIAFLRKSLGWSGENFAKHLRVDIATVRRWESRERPQSMGPQAELLLRIAVALDLQITDYGLAILDNISLERLPAAPRLTLGHNGKSWAAPLAA